MGVQMRSAHEKDHSSQSYDRDGQGPPALIIVGAHPEPETHHQQCQYLSNKSNAKTP